jgi:hypothetical protein
VSELPDPVLVCRVTTITLFLYWGVRGWLRMGSFIRRLEGIASTAGFSSHDVRRQVRRVALCATVGDPVNALLMCVVVWLWTAPRF